MRISPGSSFDSFSGFSGSVIVSGSESSESELEELSETLELYSPGSLSEIPSVPGGCSKIIFEEFRIWMSRNGTGFLYLILVELLLLLVTEKGMNFQNHLDQMSWEWHF